CILPDLPVQESALWREHADKHGLATVFVVAPTGKDALAIRTGKDEAKSTLTVWEDFRCPACKAFEDNYRDTVHELEAKGLLKVDYYLVTLIDGNMGGSGSLKAANAAACAQDAGKFAAYHDLLFQNQPQEVDDAYGKNERLLELAGQVDGLDTPAFRKCVEDGTHNSWVGKAHEAFRAGNFRGTPTVLLNGKDIFSDKADPLTPQKLKERVEAEAGASGSGAGASKDAGKAAGKGAPSAGTASGATPGATPGVKASRAPGTASKTPANSGSDGSAGN
ncbi:thioredoxin domain-containing protein, partial [Streptomyces sp. NPDC059193]|uniref:DsbA family protein n=1 Tax=Streptomyces sp. NPDC059193 TaxID=3346763 RepID=UPI00367D3F8E